jgi:predicted unusual protein kinase regulating ubiquinone biosynthesis (AarF/ABC1/UbiB family)
VLNPTDMFDVVERMAFLARLGWIIGSSFFLGKQHATILDMAARLVSESVLYVKVLQAVALNSDNAELNNYFLSMTDQAPWSDADIDYDTIRAFQEKHRLVTGSTGGQCSLKPCNSGMISLVFKFYTETQPQKCLVLKVKRRGIDAELKRAVANLSFLLWLLNFIPVIKASKVRDTVERSLADIRRQTDFELEVANMEMMRQFTADLAYIKIPTVIDHSSTGILMECLVGRTISQLPPTEREPYAKSIIRFGVNCAIQHGISHGDLHSGNILFLEPSPEAGSGPIGVLDFGIVVRLPKKKRAELAALARDVMSKPIPVVAGRVMDVFLVDPVGISDENRAWAIDSISALLIKLLDDSEDAAPISILDVFHWIQDADKRSGLDVDPHLLQMQLALAMAQGVTMALCGKHMPEMANEALIELTQ